MPLFGSWAELHAALTHFPIALLLVALFFDGAALVLRRTAWRDIGLAILALAVISMPFSLLSGYLAGRDMGRPPVGFDEHWKAAVLTTVVSAALLLWRVRTHKRTERAPQLAMMGVAFAGAVAVGYTGHMGGGMVFGGRSAPASELALAPEASVPASAAVVPATSEKATADKIAVAAGRMSSALDRMGTATDTLAKQAASQPKAPPAAAPPALDTAPLEDAARKLERVAARFEASAAKMEASARRIEARQQGRQQGREEARPAPSAPAPNDRIALGPKDKAASSSKAPPSAAAPTPVLISPSAAEAAPALVTDPRVARGKVLYADAENDCGGCHKISGEGGRRGPDLTFAGRLHPDLEWQIAHLKDPASKVPGSKMPAYADLPPADIEALAAYMVSLK